MNGQDSHLMMAEAVRPTAVGVLLDGRIQERWVLDCVRQAVTVPGVRLAAVALVSVKPWKSLAQAFHRLFDRIDQRVRCPGERLFEPVDVVDQLALRPFRVMGVRHRNGWSADDAGTAALQGCGVDLWLCFTALPPCGFAHPVSRLGVWGIEIGDGVAASNVWAGAGELSASCPVTMVNVVDYAAPADNLLYRSFGATITNSPRRNRLRALGKGISFFKRLLERLRLDRSTWPPLLPATLPAPMHYPKLPEPTLSALARLARGQASNIVANRMPLRQVEQWQIAYYFGDENEPGCQFERLRYLVPPKDRFWADPFAVAYQDRYFIFFEELIMLAPKGRLAAIEVFENAEPGEAKIILEQPYHLSYPLVFDWEGTLYMIPETSKNRTVELYRCEEFPHRWVLHKVLLDNINAVDATLWSGRGRCWMFVNVAEPGVTNIDELHLYWSATPFGPWTAHPRNPLVSDVRCARPAGPLFSRAGELYRPSQDCSVAYGHSILINRVEHLSEDGYRETAVDRIAPGWREDALRVHTVCESKRLRVIDCMMRRGTRDIGIPGNDGNGNPEERTEVRPAETIFSRAVSLIGLPGASSVNVAKGSHDPEGTTEMRGLE